MKRSLLVLSTLLLVTALTVSGCGTKNTATVSPEEKEAARLSLFSKADQSLKNADQKAAILFAPDLYHEAMGIYKEAGDDFNDGEDTAEISNKLDIAVAKFDEAASLSGKYGDYFKSTKTARDDAEKVESSKLSAPEWLKAEKTFREAIEFLDDSKSEKADAGSREAEQIYRMAELNAIKAAHLGDIRREISRLQDMGGKNNAQKSVKKAEKLANSVSDELDRQRYNNENAKQLTAKADYEVKHAAYLHDKIKSMKDEDVAYEDLILSQESDLNRIGDELGLALAFDKGFDEPVSNLVGAVQNQKSVISKLNDDISMKNRSIADLNDKIAAREKQLQDISKKDEEFRKKIKEAEEMERQKKLASDMEVRNKIAQEQERQKKLSEELERQKMTAEELAQQKKKVEEALVKEKELQAQRAKKLQAIQSTLKPKEGKVLLDGNNVIVRITGMTFASGKSAIEPKFFGILSKAMRIIDSYENCTVVVQGHTDGAGNEKNNLKLSKDRAESVRQYILANSAMAEERIKSQGFGSAQPVAKNTTQAGRAMNRRIDVVITPAAQ